VGVEQRNCCIDGVSFGNEAEAFQAPAIKRERRWMNCKNAG
jgi:hypothetical protein